MLQNRHNNLLPNNVLLSTSLLVMDQDAVVADVGEGGLGDVDVDGVSDVQADHPGLGELAVSDDSALGRYHPHKVYRLDHR